MADDAANVESTDDVEALRAEVAALKSNNAALTAQVRTAEGGKANAEQRVLSQEEQRLFALETASDNAIAAVENEAASYEGQLATFLSEGKFTEAASFQRKIGAAEAKLANERARKEYLGQQREIAKARTTEGARRTTEASAERTLADGTPLNVFNNTPRTRAWVENHPEMFTDTSFVNRSRAAHNLAVLEGITVDSQEYIDFVDAKVTKRAAPAQERVADAESPYSQTDVEPAEISRQVERPQKPAAGPGSIAAARPSRQVAGNSSGAGRPPDLTADQREVADAIYAHLPAKERYVKYVENKKFMDQRRGAPTH